MLISRLILIAAIVHSFLKGITHHTLLYVSFCNAEEHVFVLVHEHGATTVQCLAVYYPSGNVLN